MKILILSKKGQRVVIPELSTKFAKPAQLRAKNCTASMKSIVNFTFLNEEPKKSKKSKRLVKFFKMKVFGQN